MEIDKYSDEYLTQSPEQIESESIPNKDFYRRTSASCDGGSESWILGESVGEWLKRQISEGKAEFKKSGKKSSRPRSGQDLSEKSGVTNIYRLMNLKDFVFPSNSTRNKLAFKNGKESSGIRILGYYGYSPSCIAENHKGRSDNRIDTDEIGGQIHADLMSLYGGLVKTPLSCQFCNIEENKLKFRDEETPELIEQERLYHQCIYQNADLSVGDDVHPLPISYNYFFSKKEFSDKCSIFYMSEHAEKQYGAIMPWLCERFKVPFICCEKCLTHYASSFSAPLSILLKKTIKIYGMSQIQLAAEIGVKQSTVSRLLKGEDDFVDPLIVRKIYGVYVFGTLEIKKNQSETKGVINTFLDVLKMSGYRESNIIRNYSFLSNSTPYVHAHKDSKYDVPNIELCCDFFVTSDQRDVKIACFFPRAPDVRNSLMLIGVAAHLGATHVCFIYHPFFMSFFSKDSFYSHEMFLEKSVICLDIRSGGGKHSALPFNNSYLLVRDIKKRYLYEELDLALKYFNITDSQIEGISRLRTEKTLSYEGQYDYENKLQRRACRKEEPEDDEFFYEQVDRYSTYYSADDVWSYFGNENINSKYDSLLIQSSFDVRNFLLGKNVVVDGFYDYFRQVVSDSIEKGRKSRRDISEIYDLDETVVEREFVLTQSAFQTPRFVR